MKNYNVGFNDYPLGKKRPEIIKTFTGKNIAEITLSAILNDEVSDQDIRISSQTLLLQADIAEAAGRNLLAKNFRRAAELCRLPDEKVMEIYNALRPCRCTRAELESIAVELECTYEAVLCAELIREAATVYEKRGFLKMDENRSNGI
jgi:propanediol dehydratase small subunit